MAASIGVMVSQSNRAVTVNGGPFRTDPRYHEIDRSGIEKIAVNSNPELEMVQWTHVKSVQSPLIVHIRVFSSEVYFSKQNKKYDYMMISVLGP